MSSKALVTLILFAVLSIGIVGCGNPNIALLSSENKCRVDYSGLDQNDCLFGARAARDYLRAITPFTHGVDASPMLIAKAQADAQGQCEKDAASKAGVASCLQGVQNFINAMSN